MALLVAIVGEEPSVHSPTSTSWGSWQVLPWADPTVLATLPGISSEQVSEVLVLTVTAGDGPAQLAASTLSAVRPDLGVHVLAMPVSLGVLVCTVEGVADGLTSSSAVLEAIRVALAATRWGAWTPSVARLDTPSPTLVQHVQSWFLRGDGFLAVAEPDGWVAKLPVDQLEASRLLPHSGAHPPYPYECHAFGELPEAAIKILYAMGLRSRPTSRSPVGDVARTWGSENAIEFVITGPTEPGPPTGRCQVCSDPIWGRTCPWCRASVSASSLDHPQPGGTP